MNIESRLNQAESILHEPVEEELNEAQTVVKKVGDDVKIKRSKSGKIEEEDWRIININGQDVLLAKKEGDSIITKPVSMSEILDYNT
jgi:hypothetical protein